MKPVSHRKESPEGAVQMTTLTAKRSFVSEKHEFRPGDKFGAHFVRYPKGAAAKGSGHAHGDAVVLIIPERVCDGMSCDERVRPSLSESTKSLELADRSFTWRNAVALSRTAAIARKNLIVCARDPTESGIASLSLPSREGNASGADNAAVSKGTLSDGRAFRITMTHTFP